MATSYLASALMAINQTFPIVSRQAMELLLRSLVSGSLNSETLVNFPVEGLNKLNPENEVLTQILFSLSFSSALVLSELILWVS